MRVPASFLTLALLAGCATTPGTDRLAEKDPLQGFNRAIWDINQAFDTVLIKPVTVAYRAVVPRPARSGVSNALNNLHEPFYFVNNLLQGKPHRAVRSLGRFVVNSTVGVAGLGDPASKMGMKPAPEDFGQTLAVWGVNGGPYLVLPLLGPSTLRDGVGMAASQFIDPYRLCLNECGFSSSALRYGMMAGEVVDTRSQLIDSGADAFLKSSADPYTTARSAYLQRRRAAILDQDDQAAAGPGKGSDDAAMDAALKDMNGDSGTAPPPAADQAAPPANAAPAPASPESPPPPAGEQPGQTPPAQTPPAQ
ncbi:MlaA family lipoprotein [Flavisphingomonas formosensis]|uniref:MlaA family lipoprotein n=1 Tax=Flavisphingomonas formosensis TaxID=861534 RepID=UPI0012FCB867|nr:VacJ family lipoprotein [Sphingomonas formosensis]